ncbi:MAG: GNAT family N-acetyltransferase [Candidatus Limnocylindrales bacterium]
MGPAPTYRPAVELPPIAGLAFRHLRVPDDYAAMTEIANAARVAAGATFITSVEDMTNFYAHLSNCDVARDVVTVWVDDALIGYGRCAWSDLLTGGRIHELICFLDPAWRRRGIGAAMLRALEARVAEIAAADPADSAALQVATDGDDPGQTALFEGAGYRPVRYAFTMVRPDLSDQHDAPMPPGLEIREVRPEQLRAIWEADQEAFADHWGASQRTEEDWAEFRSRPNVDTTLWRIAWDGDQVAGQVRSFINADENRLYGRQRGWVEHISVRRPWRRRGLARALMAASFPLLRARGMTEGALHVDTENLTGALRVYESMGFRQIARDTVYRKVLA